MIINSRSSNFIFNFPKGFFHKDIEDKYLPYIKRMPLPFDTVHTMMNAHVQAVSFPSLSMEPVAQTRKFGVTQNYKNSKPLSELFSKDVTVTMKALDGYVNYWIMIENAMKYLAIMQENPLYMGDFRLQFLSQEGHIIQTVLFKKMILTNISEIQLSYADNQPEFKTFDVSFRMFEMDFIIDRD